jgi:transcription elongation factor Elf1
MASYRIVIIPEISGNEGEVEVSFTNSAFKTRDDLSFKYPEPDFGSWLLEELYESHKIFAGIRGVFKKKPFCPNCNAELTSVPSIVEQEEFELKFREFPTFHIKITLPWAKCPLCGRKYCLDTNGLMKFNVNEAIIDAFRSKNIKP